MRLHGIMIGAVHGEVYKVFDPAWYRFDLWVWWFWMLFCRNALFRLYWRASYRWQRRNLVDSKFVLRTSFDHGTVDVVINRVKMRKRVYRIKESATILLPKED